MDALPPANQLERIETDPRYGLTEAQASERKELGYVNTPIESPVKTVGKIVAGNVFTYFNMIFFIIAGCLIVTGTSTGNFNHLMFLPIILSNLIIGIIQELNSKRMLDKLTLLNAPRTAVIREGVKMTINSEEVVIDDIAVFTSGNQICADGIVMEGEVQVNEALITGEADEIVKRTGDDLLSGSFVTSGECRARLEKVGAESFVSQLTLNAKKARKNKDKGMMRSLTVLVKIIGIIIIPLAIFLFIKETKQLGLPIPESIEATAAAILGLIPEGLYLLTTVALAVSVIRLAKQRTLVHDLKCIELLARVNVLCVDKTGTITENEMEVADVIKLSTSSVSLPVIEEMLCDFTGNQSSDNATMKALKERYGRDTFKRAVQTVSFSSATKYSSVTIDNETYITGAPEFLLREDFERYRGEIDIQTQKGFRVLLFGFYRGVIAGGPLPNGIQPLALILLTNNIRKDAHKTFEYFAHQGVAIKVISGDNAFTAADAARRAGIKNADKYVDATTLDTSKKIFAAVEDYTVFGRVTPDQKRRIIKALKRKGYTVAMTGDGVNDVLALKEADCSIAMASGSEVACQVSNLVLLDSNFAAMPKVVAEGRRVINNIERTAALFLVKNMFSMLLALISIFAIFSYPISPAQLSYVSTLTIGLPAFILALQPNTGIVKGKFLRNVLYRAVPAAVTNIFVVVFVLLFAYAFKIPDHHMSTTATLLMCVVGLMMLVRSCKPFNLLRIIICSVMTILSVLVFAFARSVFSLSPLPMGCWLIFIIMAMLVYPVMEIISKGLDSTKFGLEKLWEKFLGLFNKEKDDEL